MLIYIILGEGEVLNILHFFNKNRKLIETSSLNKDLSDFGLKPNDWYLIQEDGLIYRIENKNEPTFFFKGRVHFRKGKKKWRSIYLAGI